MEWSSSDSDHDPSPSVPSLQNTAEDILKRIPSSPDGRDLGSPTEGSPPPTEDSPLLKVQFKRAGSYSSLPPTTAREIEAGGSDGLRHCNWKNLITTIYLWLTYLIVSAAYSIIGPFFPSEAEAKGSSSTITGVIVSCSPLCVVILSPLLGYLLPRLGLKFTLIAGLFLVGGAFVLLGFVAELPSGWVFILFCVLLRMTEGVGSAMYFTATFTLVPQFYPTRVSTAMGLFELAGGLGFAVGPVIGGALYQLGGFRLPFFSVGAFVLLSVIPCIILVRSSECAAQSLSLKMIWKLMTNFVIVVLVIANVLTLASISFFTPTLEPFLKQEFNLSPLKIGLVFLSGPGIYMLASLLVGVLSDKLGQRKFIIFGFMLFGLSYFFIGPADFIGRPRVWITCVAFGITGVGAAMGSIPIYADILNISKTILGDSEEISGPLIAVVSGIVSSTLSFGEFIGPIISGALTEFFDFQSSAVLFGEVLLAEGFLILGVTLINKFCHRT